MNQPRKSNGEYSNKFSWARVFLFSFLGIVMVSMLGGNKILSEVEQSVKPETVEASLTTDEKIRNLIEKKKEAVRLKIHTAEGANVVLGEGELFITFDPSKTRIAKCSTPGGNIPKDCLSFGYYQFKLNTIQAGMLKYQGKKVTEKEAFDISQDDVKAGKLFDEIVYGEEGGIWKWQSAYLDEQFYLREIPAIRELQAILDN